MLRGRPLLFAAAVLLALACCDAALRGGVGGDPYPPRWGGNNATLAWSAEVNMTDVSDAPQHPSWRFLYFYDWELRASRYEHAQGNRDEVCAGVSGQQAGDACTVLNSADGTLYLLFPSSSRCCRCRPALTIRSDWLQDGGTKYTGATTVRGVDVDSWLKYGASDNHYYSARDSTQRMVRYMEHKNGKLKQWDIISFSAQRPASALFYPPQGCTKQCPSKVCQV